MLATAPNAEQRVLLQNISWQLFESLLEEMGEGRSTRLAYARGNLEFMTPLFEHEEGKRNIERAIDSLLEELGLEHRLAGSTTLKRPRSKAGKEPDSCYYIQNEARVRGKTNIDLETDPPPDLAVEIDITSSSIDKLSLYAALGVPELWRYDGTQMVFYQLQEEKYISCDRSVTFQFLPPTRVDEYLQECRSLGVMAALRQFRTWIRENREIPPQG